MAPSNGRVAFVASSRVRTAVLRTLADGPAGTDDLLASVDASSSAVYGALDELRSEGLVRDGEPALTGVGRVVAELVERGTRLEELFDGTGDYFETHDTGVLPADARRRLDDLAGARVVRATETQPHRAVETVSDRVGRADRADVVSPVYVQRYGDVMPDTGDSRLVVTPGVVSTREETGDPTFESVGVRVATVEFALGVTEETLLLSLPTLDGEYDASSELVAEHDAALAWGRRLFERLWERGEPTDAF
jgi:predicted transcriptional regulator